MMGTGVSTLMRGLRSGWTNANPVTDASGVTQGVMNDDRRYVSREVESTRGPMMSQARADPLKITAVRRYFARKFPGWTIKGRRGLDRILIFTIEGGPTGQVFTVKVARNFLDDYKPAEIKLKLEQ